jgi:hypothetical protein
MYDGLVGTRPEMFLDLTLASAREAAAAVQTLQSPEDWTRFRDRYGIAQNSAKVWELNAWFEGQSRQLDPLEAGAFDLAHYGKTGRID